MFGDDHRAKCTAVSGWALWAVLAVTSTGAGQPCPAPAPIAVGETICDAISAVGEEDCYTFSAASGDVVLIRMTEIGSGPLDPQIRLLDPGGMEIAVAADTHAAEIAGQVLPTAGTYTIVASDLAADDTGDYCLHLQRLNDPGLAGPLAIGEALCAAIASQAEMDAYTFDAAAGDTVLIRMTEVISGPMEPLIRLYDPDGTLVAEHFDLHAAEVVATLPATAGTYTVLAGDVLGDATGDYCVHLQRLNAPGMTTPVVFGETVCASIDNQVEMDAYTFDAAAEDTVLIRMTEVVNGPLEPLIRLYDPDGALVAEHSALQAAEIEATLPALAGTYTLLVGDVLGDATGGYCVHLQRLNDPGMTTPIVFGETTCASIDDQAEMDAYTFDAVAGDTVLIRMTKVGTGSLEPLIRLYDPDGALVAEQSALQAAEIETTLPALAGTYTVLVGDLLGDATGGYCLHLQRLNEPGMATPITPGETVCASLAAQTEMHAYTFDAAAGDTVLIRMTEVTPTEELEPLILLYDPQGVLVAAAVGIRSVEIVATLPAVAGTYTILAGDELGDATGDYCLHVQRLNEPGMATAITPGETLCASLAEQTEMDAYTFDAAAGDTVLIRMTEVTPTAELEPLIRLYDPEGVLVAADTGLRSAEVIATLPAVAGTYTVLAGDELGDTTGDYCLHAQIVNDPGGALPLPFGGLLCASIDGVAEADAYTFDAAGGELVLVQMTETMPGSPLEPRLQLFDPAGGFVATESGVVEAVIRVELPPIAGTYTVLAADVVGDATGAYAIGLALCGPVTCAPCPWDVNLDGTVDVLDLLALLSAWGTDPGGPPDVDCSGTVDVLDLIALLANWGPC